MYITSIFAYHSIALIHVAFMEEMAHESINIHVRLHVGLFLSCKLQCQLTFTFPFLITRWIWFLGRSVWLRWLQPDISQCQAFPRIALPMSPSLDLETPSAIPSPQWKLKNVLTLKSLLCTDMQYSGTFQSNHICFANVVLGSRYWESWVATVSPLAYKWLLNPIKLYLSLL